MDKILVGAGGLEVGFRLGFFGVWPGGSDLGSSGMSTEMEGQMEGGRDESLRTVSPVTIRFLTSESWE